MPSRRLPQTTELPRHLYPLARVTRGETLYYWHRSSGILYCYTWTIATIPCLITRILYISSVSRAQRMSEREKPRDFEHEPSLFDLLSASSIPQNVFREGDDNHKKGDHDEDLRRPGASERRTCS